MEPLISVNAEMLLPNGTWEKGVFSLFLDRVTFDGKNELIDQPFTLKELQYKKETFRRRKLLFSRDYYGLTLRIHNKAIVSVCFEEDGLPDVVISALERERNKEEEQDAFEQHDSKPESFPQSGEIIQRNTGELFGSDTINTVEIVKPSETSFKESISPQIEKTEDAEKTNRGITTSPVPEIISAATGKNFTVSSEETEYVVIRINKINQFGHIIQKDEKGNLTLELDNGNILKVNPEQYLKRKTLRFVNKPDDKETSISEKDSLLEPMKNEEGKSKTKEGKKGKKINLKDATKNLVQETTELLGIVTPLRKEADALYDMLVKMQKSETGLDSTEQTEEQIITSEIEIPYDEEQKNSKSNSNLERDDKYSQIAFSKVVEQEDKSQFNARQKKGCEIGTIIRYGEYKHNKLEWVVIKNEDAGCLLLSTETIAQREFNKSFGVWSNSELKKWLNSTFQKKAFSEDEISFIYVGPPVDPNTSTTQTASANLFVLSDYEYKELVPDKHRLAYARRGNGELYPTKWWLRNSGDTTKNAFYVDEKGNTIQGSVNNDKIGVRPAIWVRYNNLMIIESVESEILPSDSYDNHQEASNENTYTHANAAVENIFSESDKKTQTVISISETDEPPLAEEIIQKKQFRSFFVKQCQDFSKYCVGLFPEKRTTSIRQKTSDKPLPHLFDLANCRFSHMEESYCGEEMPLYLHAQNGLVKCRCDGLYNEEIYSSYMLFTGKEFDDKDKILSRTIEDSIGRQKASNVGINMMCLMPDVVDDFNQTFRSQISGLFQVPRSIALAYTILCRDQKIGRKTPKEFLVVDYDCEDFNAIKIVKSQDDRGKPFFIRWGRVAIPGNHLSYRTLASEYLAKYREKNQLNLTKKIEEELIETKLIQQILLDPQKKPALLIDGNVWVNICPDYDIVDELHEMVVKDIEEICNHIDIPVYSVCSFGWSKQQFIFGIDAMDTGCSELCRRYIHHETLWEEYLPKLELGIHLDGTFSDLPLIDERERHQRITSTYLGKPVHFYVKNGLITLDKGLPHYDLPLVREVYGSINKEKKARFEPKKPFEKDESVHLRIDYRYGDVESYKLIALFDDGREPLESKWVDAEDLPNPYPVYQAKAPDPVPQYVNNAVTNGFFEFTRRINAPSMPAQWNGDSLYYPPECKRFSDRTLPYSRYLEEINGKYGFPYSYVRRFFSEWNQTQEIEQKIDEMFKKGVFTCIADVLSGQKPQTHNLAKGSSESYPNNDQRESLTKNLQDVCASLGVIYTKDSNDVEQIVNTLSKSRRVEFWAPVTTYVKRKHDKYGVWDKLSNSLHSLNPEKMPNWLLMSALRAISNVCFVTQEWIFELYHGPEGHEDVQNLIQCIKKVISVDEWKVDPNLIPYNTKRIRDVLELLLCICLLKKENPLILDCNSQETKEIVRNLKHIDNEMRRLKDEKLLQDDFNTRITGIEGIVDEEKYYKVNRVIYALIETLTGGGTINLVGFKED